MIYLAGFTYTNKHCTSFFTFKHHPDLRFLNVLLSKVINNLMDMQAFMKQITSFDLNKLQIDYLNSFLNTYLD